MKLDINVVAKKIGVPVRKWNGNCHGIALLIVRAKLVRGKVRYGHWLGEVDPDSSFWAVSGAGFCRHGWIEMRDGTIVDPTRWCFESAEPYIYIGPNNDEYDAGGNVHRSAIEQRPPEFNIEEGVVRLDFPPETEKWLARRMTGLDGGTQVWSRSQMFWLGNLSLASLEGHAKDVYRAFKKAGRMEIIPIDNRRMVLGARA